MRFEFKADRSCKVKSLLKEHDISRGLLAKIKYKGGNIWVNGIEQNAIYNLSEGDVVTVDIPNEKAYEKLKAVPFSLDIVYEDDHYLVINKPVGYASIPSAIHDNTIANFVKHYIIEQGYDNKQIHIVTRLDRDTSGLMLFAKHGYAHARLDKQLQTKAIKKRYYALVEGEEDLPQFGEITAPIARDIDSIITRRVHESGKPAKTSFQVVKQYGKVKLVDIELHTGRTHQIRVHFSHLGHPLLGDDLYGGTLDKGINRQALHCHYLSFVDPFTNQLMSFSSGLTDDFERVILYLKNQ
ncbi:RluA family pseudouridine synthase [Streptococcus sp. CSL10205-OR2]|uniref:RluA family pseudouridine synthase n=1 Tax=Streptococcus sp. CSL10205-OR2 TaxID=2980558 RepID=UPI0021DADAB2|nr:RluA family pseudouridine synthase [Streptococcus sp. CSL10205-OR2]MCU9533205.1 RluA family pseudouridine synthase [Streptococcus sp. CSL10205-OR2]